ncbi:SIMPL domain-containing protein [Christiangramia lutea]|uniref:SIMPL domain-containing protein n=1 Tax=Christiangramia lutea TaxID=1607951 RepID=UPI00311A967A
MTPDTGILNITIDNINLDFSKSINGLNSKSQDITEQLKKIGFKQSSIRTDDFNVRKNRVYRNNKSIDSGYKATQQIQLEFKNDQKNITKILDQFSKSSTEFNLNFNFKLSDSLKENVQKQIIKLATRDAIEKAELISSASNIDLIKIKQIKYGTNYNSGMRLYNRNNGVAEVVSTIDNSIIKGFTPKDIVYSENILLVWDIK